jgi:hypothetical protein
MKMFYTLFVMLTLLVVTGNAQKMQVYKLDSKSGNIIYSQPTNSGSKYRITVEGTYRQWPASDPKGFGVDAVWYNDIPVTGNSALDELIKNYLQIPVWLGDSSTFTIPSIPQVFNGIKLGMRQFTGFRLDGLPFDKFPIDSLNHRYQIEKMGNGGAFYFQILDSVYSLVTETTEPRYDDNIGSLMVTIEELGDTTANICGLEVINQKDGSLQLKVKASLITKDTTSTNGEKNLLYEVGQIGIIDNGRFVCPDSLVCNEKSQSPIAVGILVDRSASMEEPISQDDLFTTRLSACKDAIRQFMDNLQFKNNPKDSAFVISFSNRTKTEQDWTDSKDSLNTALDKIKPDSATAFYTALLEALEKVSKHSSSRKSVIALTDGDNTRGPVWSKELLEQISKKYSNIQIYLIALSFNDSDISKKAMDTMNQIVSKVTKGNVFSIFEKDSLAKIYENIAWQLSEDECCSLYFHSEPCKEPGHIRTIKLVFINDGNLIVKEISFKCPETVTSVPFENDITKPEIMVKPNPFNRYGTVEFKTDFSDIANISIYDGLGNKIKEFEKFFEFGQHQLVIDGNELNSGIYFIRITARNSKSFGKFVVIH